MSLFSLRDQDPARTAILSQFNPPRFNSNLPVDFPSAAPMVAAASFAARAPREEEEDLYLLKRCDIDGELDPPWPSHLSFYFKYGEARSRSGFSLPGAFLFVIDRRQPLTDDSCSRL